MQATGPEADAIRIDIFAKTHADLAGLRAATLELEKLGTRLVQTRDQAGRFALKQEETSAALRKTGSDLSQIAKEGFSPRFIGSLGQVNQEFVRLGESFSAYGKTAQAGAQVNQQVSQSFQNVGQQMVALGLTGNVTAESFIILEQQLAKLSPITATGQQGVALLNESLARLKLQFMEAGMAAEQRMMRPLTTTQKAGQGLLLSFALTQAAAGNLSAAFFGLGFAVIFTGTQFINLTTASVALGAAMAGMVVKKLETVFAEGATFAERMSERMNELREQMEEVRGETEYLVSEFESEIQSAEDLTETLDFLTAKLKVYAMFAELGGDNTEQLVNAFMILARTDLDSFIRQVDELSEASSGFGDSLGTTLDVLQEYGAALEAARRKQGDILDEAREEILAYQQDLADVAEQARIESPFEFRTGRIEEQFQIVNELARSNLEEANQIVRDSLDEQIGDRQTALRDETDVIREGLRVQTEAIQEGLERQLGARRDALEEEIDAIRDRYEEQTDVVRDALEDQIDVIRDKLEDRIDAIRDAAEAEVEAEREKIDAIRDQERALEAELRALQARRATISAEIIGAEAELAALEAEVAKTGVAATEEEAIIKARIAGLKAEQAAIDETVEAQESVKDQLEEQIEAIEDVIDAVNDARDETIDAARDAADAQIDAARDAADEQIDAINDVRDRAIKAARDRAEAEMNAATKAANAVIREAQRASSVVQQAAKDRANEDIKQYRRAAASQISENQKAHRIIEDNLRDEEKRQLAIVDAQKQRAVEERKYALFIRNTVLPLAKEYFALQVAAGVLPALDLTGITDPQVLGNIARQQLILFLESMFPGTNIANLIPGGFQLGTRRVPGAMGQPMLARVHGGEEINAPGAPRTGYAAPTFVINVRHMDVNRPTDVVKLANQINRMLGQKVIIAAKVRQTR